VTLVQYLLQAQAKQVIAGTRLLLFRLHEFTRNQREITSILAISSALVYPSRLISVRDGEVFQGGLLSLLLSRQAFSGRVTGTLFPTGADACLNPVYMWRLSSRILHKACVNLIPE
jgi:hypothetical protein